MERKYYIPPGLCVKISVPATSANLGPGYDSMGLALNLRNTVQVETFQENHHDALRFTLSGEGAEKLPQDKTHLIIASMLQCWDYVKKRSGLTVVPGGLHLTACNKIPQSRGLGSSAAAIVAGVMCAVALLPADLEEEYSQKVFQIASKIEGHPDNIASALSGGATISWQEQQEANVLNDEKQAKVAGQQEVRFQSVKLEVHPQIIPVVAVPDYEVSTAQVRALMPGTIPHDQAALNSAKAALLIHALTTDPAVLYPATEDFLHQRYRVKAMEPSAAMVRKLRLNGFAAVVSGAGPTVLVFAAEQGEADKIMAYIKKYVENDSLRWHISLLAVDRSGVLEGVARSQEGHEQ